MQVNTKIAKCLKPFETTQNHIQPAGDHPKPFETTQNHRKLLVTNPKLPKNSYY